nr:hypothetical protein GCM10017611_63770 [Rhodococcus wratislaviensis]
MALRSRRRLSRGTKLAQRKCNDPAVSGVEWGILGFSCTEQMQLLVSVSPANSEFPTDKVTLLLTSDGSRPHLFVNAEGH